MRPRGERATQFFGFLRRAADVHTRLTAYCGAVLARRPCVCVLFSVIAVEIFLLPPSAVPYSTAVWIIAGAACATLLFLNPKQALSLVVLPAAAAALAMYCHWTPLTGPDDLTRMMAARHAYGEMELIADDAAAVPGGPEDERPKPSFARLKRIRFFGEDEWREVSARVSVSQRKGPFFHPGFGDVLRVKGLISEPRGALVPGGFDAKKYLAGRNIRWTVAADSGTVSARGHGLRRSLCDARDALLDRVTGPMRDDDAKALTAGILFGRTDGIPTGMRHDFLRCGAIHILSVSGMHVGLFAAVLFLIFAFLPFRLRCGLVIALTFFYAMATGLREPALRAFLMLAVVLGSRAFLLRTDSMNTLAAVAAALLLIDPAGLTDIGFQFSFLTVAVLLAATQWPNTYFRTVSVGFRWTPVKFQTRAGKAVHFFRNRMLTAVAAPVFAFAAAFALTAFYQNLLPGSGIAANLLLIPLLLPAFGCALASAVFSFVWPGAGVFFARLLEELMRLILWLTGVFSEIGVLDFASPPLWSVWLFLLLLAALFLPFSHGAIWRSAIVLCLCGTAAFWHFRTVCAPPEAAVFYGGGTMPAIAVALPRERTAYLAGLPDAETAAGVSDFLRARGIVRIRVLVTAGTGGNAVYFLERLRGIDVGETASIRNRSEKTRFFHAPGLTAERSGDTFHFQLDTLSCGMDASVEPIPSGGYRVLVRRPSGEGVFQLECPPSLTKKYVCRTLEEKGNER